MKTRFILLMAAVIMLSFNSCKKNTDTVDQTSVNLADDDAISDAIFEDVYNTADYADIILDQVARSGESKSVVVTDSCPTVEITHPGDGFWPKIITVDYGDGCSGYYESTRSGKIIIEVTGPRLEAGSKRTITFENYFFNGIKVEGTKVVENLGFNDNQNLVFSIQLTGGKLTLPTGETIERTVDHQREWIAGLLTNTIWDDECLITGTASGVNIAGVAYTNTITTALHWQRVCFFIVGGVLQIEREGHSPVVLDYGTGDCDAKAVVTKDGESREINLRHKHRLMGM
jgi:hypothetical protein